MFVVMGATGQAGGAVVAALADRGKPVRILTRDPARAAGVAGGADEIVRIDATDPGSFGSAFLGVEAAFVLLAPSPQAGDVLAESHRAGRAISVALHAARVSHVVALSSAGAHLAEGNGIVRCLHDFERTLCGAAPSLVYLRAGDFMENWAAQLPTAREASVLPSARLPLEASGETVSAIDVGRTAADLLFEVAPGTRIVNLAGPAAYSAIDAADILSRLFGKTITAVPSRREETIAGLKAAGAAEDYAAKLADLYDAINEGRIDFPSGSGEMRRGKIALDEALRRLVEASDR